MPSKLPRVSFVINAEELEMVKAFQMEHKIKSLSKAVIAMIEQGLINEQKRLAAQEAKKEEQPAVQVDLSPIEQSHIKKYRLLDPYGKEAVDGVLDVEWRRCKQPAEEQASLYYAARKSDEPHAATGPDTDVEI